MEDAFRKICLEETLETYDPYDIWKTEIGFRLKYLFNKNRIIAALPALGFSFYDQFLNNGIRIGYQKQEYPIVRALAAQIVLNEYAKSNDLNLLNSCLIHLEWIRQNISKGYSGACWGLGFKWAAFGNIVYDANTPHSTHTPYALEAMHLYTKVSGDNRFVDLIKSCYDFYEMDLKIMYDQGGMMAISYGPFGDKIVNNASSYTLYAYSIFLSYFPEKKNYIISKIFKLYNFITSQQQANGSWFYSNDGNSFIDCFHSCIIIKNLLKASKTVELNGVYKICSDGYSYITKNFYNKDVGLYKRFTKSNKLSLTKFDLYDNSEVLNLAILLGDTNRITDLNTSIKKHFIYKSDIYSVIDHLGMRRNKNLLRWAVMPYLYALSLLKS